MKREIILNNLDCANCAQKIENQVKKIEEIEASNLNFVAKKLVIEVKDLSKIDIIEDKIKNIVKKTEPDVEVIFEGKKTKMKKPYKNRKEEIILGVSIILYFVAFLLKLNEVLQIVLFTITYLLVGYEVLLKSFRNILKGEIFDENFLMSVATIGAFAIKQYPEAAAVMLFYQIGEYIQGLAVKKSRKSIASLMDIRPDYANLKQGILIKKVSPKDVKIDDLIIVKPGEKIPLDGIVVDGKSMVDSSALTGESKLKQLKIGDDALSGFINKNGVLTIKVTKNFGESTVSKILDLVEHASSKKAKTENFITKFAKIYTPVVVFIAVGLAIIPPFILQIGVFQDWFYRALIFLVISCPCALVISIPLGFFGGIGAASKHGILVKGSNYLESLNQVEIVVFDKTGTLTKGTFKVNKIEAKNKFKEDELLEYVAYAENYSNHPIAKSILEAYEKNVDRTKIEDHEEIEGYGIKSKVFGKSILAGNAKLMIKENIKFEDVNITDSIVHIAIDNVYAGFIIIADEIKEDTIKTIKELKKMGVKKTVMLTGDNINIASTVAKKIGIDEFYGELLPQDKVEKIENLIKDKSKKGKLIFVGDGINDAPVLAMSDVGVSMGALGSDAAIEASDIVIMTDEPSRLVDAIFIAKRTRKIVWQNIIFALGVKLLVLMLGAFGVATIWEAVFADVGVTVIAILNAMRVPMNFKKNRYRN